MVTELDQKQALGQLVDDPLASELGERFGTAGHELYLVGGSVRDALLRRGDAQPDLDFATSAHPKQSEALLRGWADDVWLTGVRFGTVSAMRDGVRVEVTTFRSDRYTAGSRHPKVEYGSSIEEDLARRDFTVNAMAVRMPDRYVVDPHDGWADLRAGVLATPLEPEVSFADDPLRMLRLARFVATLDFVPAPEVVRAARRMAGQLATISAERIREELDKLLAGHAFARGLDLLVDTGLADVFLPELPALRMERDRAHHHKDVYAHTLAVVAGVHDEGDPVLLLAALFHDVGKPPTRRFHPDGSVTFHHHEVVGARMTRTRLEALRYPTHVTDAVCHLVALHLRFHGYADGEWTDSAVRRYVHDAGSDEQLRRLNLLTRADVTTRNARRRERLAAAMDDLEARIERLRHDEELAQMRPPLDGHQIMAHLGLEPGPLVGQARAFLLERRIEEGPLSEEEAYALLDRWAAEHLAG